VAPAAGLVALTFAAYSATLLCGYVWDDDLYLTENPAIVRPEGLVRIWASADCPQYYPLVFTTFWIEHKLWGFAPAGYHAVNVVLHAANSLLLAAVLRRLGLRGAWLAAAIFAVHPVHVESVAWITERKNVLYGLFYLLAVRSFLRFEDAVAERGTPPTGVGRPAAGRSGSYVVGLACFAAAMLSKTVACTLPVALLLVHWARGRPITRAFVLRLAPFFAVGLGLALVTIWFERFRVQAIGPDFERTLAERIIIAGRAVWFYAGKLVWPANITFIYPRWTIYASSLVQYAAPTGVVAVLAGLWLLRRRVGRWPFAAAAYFVITLSPALGLINIYFTRFSFVADHFQYMASVGVISLLAGVAVWAFEAVPAHYRSGVLTKAVPALCLIVLAFFTWMQTLSYANAETLWRDTIKRNPQAWIAHSNLGVLLRQRGEAAAAIECHREAIRLYSGDAYAWAALGSALKDVGRVDEGIEACRRAIELSPNLGDAHYVLAEALVLQERWSEAIQHYDAARRINPDEVRSVARRAEAMAASGEPEEAVSFAPAELARLRTRPNVLPEDLVKLQRVIERLRAESSESQPAQRD